MGAERYYGEDCGADFELENVRYALACRSLQPGGRKPIHNDKLSISDIIQTRRSPARDPKASPTYAVRYQSRSSRFFSPTVH